MNNASFKKKYFFLLFYFFFIKYKINDYLCGCLFSNKLIFDNMILNTLLFIIGGMIGPGNVIIIIVALLLFFGGRKIPELMKGLGQGIREFKKASKDEPEPLGSANPQKELEA